MTKDEVAFLIEIHSIFGNVPKPKMISGLPAEPWQERLIRNELSDVSWEDFWHAIDHVFPGHYGDVNVFRYLLSGSLCMFVVEKPKLLECLDKRVRKCMAQVPKALRKRGFSESYYAPLIKRCFEWRSQLNHDELEAIGTAFTVRFLNDCISYGEVSPYHFTYFIMWFKSVTILKEALASVPVDVGSFKTRGRDILEGYRHLDDMSALAALTGVYFTDDRKKCMSEEGTHWRSDGMGLLLESELNQIVAEGDRIRLDKELEDFFAE